MTERARRKNQPGQQGETSGTQENHRESPLVRLAQIIGEGVDGEPGVGQYISDAVRLEDLWHSPYVADSNARLPAYWHEMRDSLTPLQKNVLGGAIQYAYEKGIETIGAIRTTTRADLVRQLGKVRGPFFYDAFRRRPNR